MIKEFQLRVLPRQAVNESALKDYLVHEEGLDFKSITHVRVLKRSIDARQRTIFVNLKVRVFINEQPTEDDYQPTFYPDVSGRPSVIVVGAGPGVKSSFREPVGITDIKLGLAFLDMFIPVI